MIVTKKRKRKRKLDASFRSDVLTKIRILVAHPSVGQGRGEGERGEGVIRPLPLPSPPQPNPPKNSPRQKGVSPQVAKISGEDSRIFNRPSKEGKKIL